MWQAVGKELISQVRWVPQQGQPQQHFKAAGRISFLGGEKYEMYTSVEQGKQM